MYRIKVQRELREFRLTFSQRYRWCVWIKLEDRGYGTENSEKEETVRTKGQMALWKKEEGGSLIAGGSERGGGGWVWRLETAIWAAAPPSCYAHSSIGDTGRLRPFWTHSPAQSLTPAILLTSCKALFYPWIAENTRSRNMAWEKAFPRPSRRDRRKTIIWEPARTRGEKHEKLTRWPAHTSTLHARPPSSAPPPSLTLSTRSTMPWPGSKGLNALWKWWSIATILYESVRTQTRNQSKENSPTSLFLASAKSSHELVLKCLAIETYETNMHWNSVRLSNTKWINRVFRPVGVKNWRDSWLTSFYQHSKGFSASLMYIYGQQCGFNRALQVSRSPVYTCGY